MPRRIARVERKRRVRDSLRLREERKKVEEGARSIRNKGNLKSLSPKSPPHILSPSKTTSPRSPTPSINTRE